MESKKGRANHRDQNIALKIRQARMKREMTQAELAQMIGVTPQQVQKYEQARNRISASRLEAIAMALNKPVTHFYAPDKSDELGEIFRFLMRIDRKLTQFLANNAGRRR